ncbi:hypothetical protein MYCTH_2293977 [Thermothelomyces thermophilus ATCC 42464]|uniref:Mitochondrial outer membrane transport complex Sam37/metaxin N-terminal domain-containing protein n=1 Tax=Thermothelomyces thermophilus (strain ATCC 42464 / BCRC 31852 / DSM 1799) TaxID=573729 RepID=G2Q6R7_THET4|nr:uncharacterized protein MYCTH_2293977 [Thermothelomyces thermophilus ATCC 42464]AEO53097.1 hypothetical protein MYCTH_2293977 [Thermothelomyces thermophilus ATCC 42464]6WUH_C Chain C, Tom37 domain-containing protein [Thermothelomyces thermophilus]
MAVQLHVWGPAFGLPSIDAECLAAIAYLAQTLGSADYQLIQSSPSAVPTQHLPTLYDSRTSTWIGGFTSITAHLHTHPPPTFQSAPQPTDGSSSTTTTTTTTTTAASATADGTAYTAFLSAHAAPLLALSLYVSSANYGAATRPAYSAVLPLPLPWTEPPAVRAAMARRAAHLGLSSLDADAAAERARAEERRAAADGWVAVPPHATAGRAAGGGGGGGGGGGKGGGVAAVLTPEQKSRIRLEEAAREVLDVLAEVDWAAGGGGRQVAAEVRCLAFGYLALMLLPDVPRPWLREIMEGRYPALCTFVRDFRARVFPQGGKLLPWADGGAQASASASASASAVALRFVRAVMAEVPLVGEWWSRWWTARKKREVLASKGAKPAPSNDLLLLLGAGLGLTVVGAGVFFYRGLPPFGEAVQVWRKPVVGLSSFGAAGAMFSGALYGLD